MLVNGLRLWKIQRPRDRDLLDEGAKIREIFGWKKNPLNFFENGWKREWERERQCMRNFCICKSVSRV